MRFASGVNGMMPGSCRAAHAFITWRLAKSRKRYKSMLMVRLAIAGRQPLGGAVAPPAHDTETGDRSKPRTKENHLNST